MDVEPSGPLNVAPALRQERAAFASLLAGLGPDEWRRPTECPAWTVQGVALHLLGDDLSLLSRQRDVAQPAVFRTSVGEWAGRYDSLDEFNEAWVETAQFLSPRLLVELLELTGQLTLDWYTTVDPHQLGEAVAFYSDDPAPYWMIAAREYLERWIHHSQVARALDRAPLTEPELLRPALATAMRAFPQGLRALPAPDGTTVAVSVGDDDWTLLRRPGGWVLSDGRLADPAVRLWAAPDAAALVFSRGLTAGEIPAQIAVDGDAALGAQIVGGIGVALGRSA